jgi:hypothetical protein
MTEGGQSVIDRRTNYDNCYNQKDVPFGFDPARSDALSELLAQHWWAVGF